MTGRMNPNSLPPRQVSHNFDVQFNRSDNVPTLRLYQVWKGRNRFCFGGRLIFGPDVRSLFLTVFLIVTPVALFCGFVCKSFIRNFPYHLGILVVALCAVLTVYVIVVLLLTSSRDPGIIPRNKYPPHEDEGDSCLAADWTGSQNGYPRLPPTKDVVVNGIVVRVKYCQTCMLYRPPRCSHCSVCNNCVERFDHHCPWVGQCIGKRNYRLFFMFVSSTTLLCLYVFTFCWVSIHRIMQDEQCHLGTAFVQSPVTGFLLVYTFLALWFVGGLTAFHLYFISTNQTTYENFRYRYDRKMNPYNLGCAGNFWEIFCAKIAESRNNFRAKVRVYPSSGFTPSVLSLGGVTVTTDNSSVDMEMGRRRAVGTEDLVDVQSHVESIGRLERCGTEPRHKNWNHYRTDWGSSPDFSMLPDDFANDDQMDLYDEIHGTRSHISV